MWWCFNPCTYHVKNQFPKCALQMPTCTATAWWAGATKDGGDEPLAPKCDSERQKGCEVRCEMTAEGELVCEGLSSGAVQVESS